VKKGLIIGKFYPPHLGHKFLIDTALADCEGHVLVLVLWDSQEKVPWATRERAIEAMCKTPWLPNSRLRVFSQRDELSVDYTNDAVERQHVELIQDALERCNWEPTHLYSSESYGPSVAEKLGLKHVMVDQYRLARPISATKIRNDVPSHWDFLHPYMKAHLLKRVVVCGAESTGTTTLAKALAERYQTVWVPEYGRTFSEAVGNHHIWSSDDFEHIIDWQNMMDDDFSQYSGPVMFCDTDNIATLMFHELYMGRRAPDSHWSKARNWARYKTLYIVTSDNGVSFEDDGYRLFRSQRHWATNWFTSKLEQLNLPYIVVNGSHEERVDQAIQAIGEVMTWNLPTKPERGKVEPV
jgi:HTH-type transcriptional regulator, transcriptional repressor of NAD biosynthesis genes